MRNLGLLKVVTMATETLVTLLFEGSWSSYLGSIFFVPVEFAAQFIAKEIMLP